VDFWPLYLNAQAVIIGEKLEKAGEAYAFLSPDQLGVRFAANSVVTTREMVEKRPDTVRRFLAALLDGWRAALDPRNQAQAVQMLLEADRETPEIIVRRQLAVTRDLMLPPADGEFGKIDAAAWKQTEEIMRAQKLIPAPVDIDSLLRAFN
jgi:NitT/TauT family transport system substrate-binding protein